MDQEERWLLNEKHEGEKSEGFFADLELLQNGIPLAYLIGSVPFLNCTIHLDSRPLIPRSETEFWTEKAIETIRNYVRNCERTDGHKDAYEHVKILDLCAGSGAIGVAVANAIPEAHVVFGEIEKEHLSTIAKNLLENDVPCTRYKIFQSDLFVNIENPFDFILTNPPYIDPQIDRTEVSVKAYEPHRALYGGENGMECIRRILAEAPQYLTINGQLWIEHEPEQAEAIAELATKYNFSSATHKDQYNTPRYSVLTRSALE